ncbi:hypothetical protein [Achromobacter aloeverae]
MMTAQTFHPGLPGQEILFRARVPGFPGLHEDLTFYVAVSDDSPMPTARRQVVGVIETVLRTMTPLGTYFGASLIGELLDPQQLQAHCFGSPERDPVAGLFEVTEGRARHVVEQPVFLVPNPATYLRAWNALQRG